MNAISPRWKSKDRGPARRAAGATLIFSPVADCLVANNLVLVVYALNKCNLSAAILRRPSRRGDPAPTPTSTVSSRQADEAIPQHVPPRLAYSEISQSRQRHSTRCSALHPET